MCMCVCVCVSSLFSMSHVTHVNESCHTRHVTQTAVAWGELICKSQVTREKHRGVVLAAALDVRALQQLTEGLYTCCASTIHPIHTCI